MNFNHFLVLFLNGITHAGFLFVIASGLMLVFGLMRIINLAHGAFYIMAATLGFFAYQAFGSSWIMGLLSATVAMSVFSFLFYKFFLQRASEPSTAILVTLGISWIIIDICLELTMAESRTILPEGILRATFAIGNINYPLSRLFVLACAIVQCIALYLMIKKTKIGQTIRAGVDDRDMVSALGIDINNVFLWVFTLSGLLIGIGGVLGATMGAFNVALAPPIIQVLSLMVIIIGGSSNILGLAAAAMIIGLVNSFAMAFVPNLADVLVFTLVMVVLVLKPDGLFSKEVRTR